MDNFIYSILTTAYFGKGQIKILGETIKAHGGSNVLLAYGGGSIKKNGIYDATIEQLGRAGLAHTELSGIVPNPRVESVAEGIRLYRENGCDFILAVGGGSTLDACKAIAAGVMYDGPVTDLFVNASGLSDISAAAPLATILTMAGTGSEMDMGAVITVGEHHKKEVVMHPLVNPLFSILDPEYTYSVPEYHSMALAGFQFMLGKPMFPFPLHGMGHELSSKYDMTHGVTLALLTPSWMRHTIKTALEHLPVFARFARNVMDSREKDDAKAAKVGVKKLEAFYAAIRMPANLHEAGVKEEDLAFIAEKAAERGNLGILTSIGKDEVLQIMRDAF
ncbi:MAG: iron-containing alcohol dehydrogenase [Proteobacteria bacterium]|nr:iron-containing alcohol dehydrogenase [Pseudomonadota bacterium]